MRNKERSHVCGDSKPRSIGSFILFIVINHLLIYANNAMDQEDWVCGEAKIELVEGRMRGELKP